MEINIDDYLTHEEMKEVVKDCIRHNTFKTLEKEDNVKRIISNGAYDVVSKMVDESLDIDIKELMKTKVINIISDLTEYSVFQKPSAYSTHSNLTYDYFKKIVVSQYPVIKEKVEKAISNRLDNDLMSMLKDDISELIHDSIMNTFKNT